ncbi:hypothetical protein M9Y10_028222 [Tritrichomonas musculus]|uniref:F5/8 type C domain-containing protein n=1 Tax=Tritrichomonas musculus TaxID=1915356 RepID=A0ABR2KIW9_9EUKA
MLISSSGLKNVIINSGKENDFTFIYGDHEIRMNKFFAEFISPNVSRLRHSDPTANSIRIDNIIKDLSYFNFQSYDDLFTTDSISLLHQISSGHSIELNEDQSIKLRLISILLGNDELFAKINELFPLKINDSNIDQYLVNLPNLEYLSQISTEFSYSDLIDFISSHFFSIDQSKLIKMPKSILFSIISNKKLRITSEDSLLDFITEIFKNDENDEQFNINQFYEAIEINGLSENKLFQFLNEIELSEISRELWGKIIQCINRNESSSIEKLNKTRYSYESFIFDGNPENSFKGIIHYLTQEVGGNVSEKGTVDVTSSSSFGDGYSPKNSVDLEDKRHYFESQNKQNSWLKYDFKELKVHPTHYTIRTRHDNGKGGYHLKNWVIEGSNSDDDNDWKILDQRSQVTCLDAANLVHTFNIQNHLESHEWFRYLRIRQIGTNIAGNNFLTLSALEYFGLLN